MSWMCVDAREDKCLFSPFLLCSFLLPDVIVENILNNIISYITSVFATKNTTKPTYEKNGCIKSPYFSSIISTVIHNFTDIFDF